MNTDGATKKGKVVIGLSGGVDSAVAAAILKQQGYEVVGVTLSLFAYASEDGKGCCSFSDTIDATQVCDLLGIEHFVFSRRKTFKSEIIDKFVDGHKNWIVTNPCISCNTLVKMPTLLLAADQIGAEFVATGHYANINDDGILCRGTDRNKDQSYFLWQLPPASLKRILFPLGGMNKPQVRDLAEKFNIHIAKKKDSINLCFLEGGKASDFLSVRGVGNETGDFIDQSGNKLGTHKGLNRYVRGQKADVVSKDGKPKFVLNVIHETNSIVIGQKEEAFVDNILIKDVIFHSEEIFDSENLSVFGAVCRYGVDAIPIKSIIKNEDGTVKFYLTNPVYGIARGQEVVFYKNDNEVVGGGIVE